MTNLADLVAPLEGHPAGPDMTYDANRAVIEAAFATSAEGTRAGDIKWADVIAMIRAQALVTRDLWLAIYLARAGANAGSLDVVVDGADLLAGLLEGMWVDVHPSLEEDGFLGRKNACDSLANHGGFVQPLKRVVLIADPRLGSYSATELEQFDLLGEEAEGYGKFRAVIEKEETAEIIDATIAQLDRIRDALRRADTVLMQEAGSGTGTDFSPTYTVLAQIRAGLARYSRTASAGPVEEQVEPGAEAGIGVAAPSEAAGGFKAGRIETREDVLRAIDAIVDYYKRREPGSAVPIAMRRARDWVPMTFMQVLADIAPSNTDEARRVLMSQMMIDEANRD